MKYNIEKTFSYVAKDPNWVKKILIGGAICLGSFLLFLIPPIAAIISKTFNAGVVLTLIICMLIGCIGLLSLSGYGFQTAQDRINNEDAMLPDWNDFWGFVLTGLKSLIGSSLYFLPVIILAVISAIFSVMEKHAETNHLASYSNILIVSFIVSAVYQLFNVIFTFFLYLMSSSFVKDFNIFSYLNFAKAYRRIKGNVIDYVILVLLILAVSVVFNIVLLLLAITIVGIIALPFVGFYSQLVVMELIARFTNISEKEIIVE